jgi:hypothetical protein
MADNQHENLIQNSIRNPGLIDSDPSVTWNNRANIPECKFYQYVRLDIDEKKPVFVPSLFSNDKYLYLHR